MAMLSRLPGIVVQDSELRGGLLTRDLPDFALGGLTVKAGGDENADALSADSGRLQPPKQRRQHHRVRGWTRDIANRDRRRTFSRCQACERSTSDRAIQRGLNRRDWVGQGRGRNRFENAVFEAAVQLQAEPAMAEGEF